MAMRNRICVCMHRKQRSKERDIGEKHAQTLNTSKQSKRRRKLAQLTFIKGQKRESERANERERDVCESQLECVLRYEHRKKFLFSLRYRISFGATHYCEFVCLYPFIRSFYYFEKMFFLNSNFTKRARRREREKDEREREEKGKVHGVNGS
jgi:hypothetical protein